MIAKNYKDGVAYQYNEYEQEILLIDRGETTLTELTSIIIGGNSSGAMNSYAKKELNIIVASGSGSIEVNGNSIQIKKNDMIYVPATCVYQLKNNNREAFELIVFSAFLSDDKEGCSSFDDYYNKTKMSRNNLLTKANELKPKLICGYKNFKKYEFGSNDTYLLVDRAEAESSETTVVSWPAHSKGAMVSHSEKEQTFFVIDGTGWVTVDGETKPVKPGDVVRIPFKAPHTTEAGEKTLIYYCMNTIVTEETEPTFDQMFHRVIEGRLKRWKSGDTSVGC